MVENTLEMAKKGLALSQRDREMTTEHKAEELREVGLLIIAGKIHNNYWDFAHQPSNSSEHTKLPPQFKGANQDLHELEKILRVDRSKLKALEAQAMAWNDVAKHFDTQDTSRTLNYMDKEYRYPARELEAERKVLSKIEAKGEQIITSLNQLARSEPQVLDNAGKRLKVIRTMLKVPQSYEEIQQGLPPIEKPAAEFIGDLRHAEQGARYRAKRVLADAGIDGDSINKESDAFDLRTGRPILDQTDMMVVEAREAHARQGVAASPVVENKGTQDSG